LMSRLDRNVPYFSSLEMSSSDFIQVMLGWCVELLSTLWFGIQVNWGKIVGVK
jgi:hypothetical protein